MNNNNNNNNSDYKNKVWDYNFGKNCKIAQSPDGKIIKRNCTKINSPYYSTIDHINPRKRNNDPKTRGANALTNLYPVSKKFNDAKKDSKRCSINGLLISVIEQLSDLIKRVEGIEDKGPISCYYVRRPQRKNSVRFCIFKNKAYILDERGLEVIDVLELATDEDLPTDQDPTKSCIWAYPSDNFKQSTNPKTGLVNLLEIVFAD